jgi:hypothetical protein
MPQGRRKVPFSGKAKKVQMLTKRERKEETTTTKREEVGSTSATTTTELSSSDKGALLLDVQLHGKGSAHRYDLVQ